MAATFGQGPTFTAIEMGLRAVSIESKCQWFELPDPLDGGETLHCTSGKPPTFRNCGIRGAKVCEDHRCRCEGSARFGPAHAAVIDAVPEHDAGDAEELRELREDRLRGFRIAHPFTLETQTVEEMAADLVRQLKVARQTAPIPMILHCPRCGLQHVDEPQPEIGWTNPPHRSHSCRRCKTIWRPADVSTVGVETIETRGKVDTWPSLSEEIRECEMTAVGCLRDLVAASEGLVGCPGGQLHERTEAEFDGALALAKAFLDAG